MNLTKLVLHKKLFLVNPEKKIPGFTNPYLHLVQLFLFYFIAGHLSLRKLEFPASVYCYNTGNSINTF